MRAPAFDVICIGRSSWSFTTNAPMRLLGGVIDVAFGLAHWPSRPLRVALATTIWNDGRKLHQRMRALRIDTSKIVFASGLLVIDGTTGQPFLREEPLVEIPDGQSRVLLVSGLIPSVAQAAIHCRAARAARRAGTAVVIDINAQWQLWAGHDPRAMHMLLREADVVHCGAEDAFILDMNVRRAMRSDATLVSSTDQAISVSGTFGEWMAKPRDRDAITTALCAELAGKRTANPFERALGR